MHVNSHGELIAFAEAKVHSRNGDGTKPVRCRKCFLAESYRYNGRLRSGDLSWAVNLAGRSCVFLCRSTSAQIAAAKFETGSAEFIARRQLSSRHSRVC